MLSHKEIIERLGRTKDVADFLGVPSQRVSEFKRFGIPWKFRPAIAEKAEFDLPADFLKPRDAA